MKLKQINKAKVGLAVFGLVIATTTVVFAYTAGFCNFFDLVSTGTCGGLAGATGCGDTPKCQLITCSSDWSCPSGNTYLFCDNPPYTAHCNISYGSCPPLLPICWKFVPAGTIGNFPCHNGNTVSCGG